MLFQRELIFRRTTPVVGDDVPPAPEVACIDDDTSVREALEGLLVAFGFAVKTFASAEEFLSSAQMERFSCLITDMKLGGMSGLQLHTSLLETGRSIPTIIITAFGDECLQRQATEAGVIALLRKPITREDLLSSIRLALNRSATGNENL